MNRDQVFVVSCSEDGDISVVGYEDIKAFEEDLTAGGDEFEFLEEKDELGDPMYWDGKQLAIIGRIAKVTPRETAVTFDVK